MNYASFQIIGKRKRQEDAYFIAEDGKLFAIFDGVGGSDDGQLASKMMLEAIDKKYSKSNIQSISNFKSFASELANSLWNKTKLNIATTMSLVYFDTRSVYIAGIGDTRVYVLDRITKKWEMTRDHSIVQELYEAGILTSEAEMRLHPLKNRITKAISSLETLREDEIEFKITERIDNRSYILLASDGVFEAFDHEMLISVLLNKELFDVGTKIREMERICSLISRDNCTCILIQT